MLGQIQNVDPKFLHQFLLVLVGVIGGAAGLATVVGVFLKRRTTTTVEPQPVAVTVTVPEINRRLDGHDKEITNLWNTMRVEDAATREEMNKCFQHIERSLGRIEGKLNREL